MRYRQGLASLFAATAIVAGLGPTMASASTNTITFVSIRNYGSNLCIQPSPASPGSIGVQLTQEPCDGNPAQVWGINDLGGGNYQFQNQSTGGCMDAHGANADRTPVDTWPCSTISNQRWHVGAPLPNAVPAQVVSAIGSRCLDVQGGGGLPGTPIQIYHCTSNNAAQVWLLHAPGS